MKNTNYPIENIIIDKNVERMKESSKPNKWYVLFMKMAIDDSFAIPFETRERAKLIQGSIQQAKRNYRNKFDRSFQGTCRILFIKKEVRFWRDK